MRGLLLFLLTISLLLLPWPASAQSRTTCDACGYCQNLDTHQIPGNWRDCARCLYGSEDPNVTLSTPADKSKSFTVFGCLEIGSSCNTATDPDCAASAGSASFANVLLRFFSTAVGGVAFLVMIFGGLRVMLAKGDPDGIREGKRYVYGAILGLIVVVCSVLIVKFIGGSILQIPYLQ